MFSSHIKKSLKIITLVSFLGALFFGSFCIGMFHAKTMHTVEKSQSSSIVQKGETCCGSTFLEKTTLWQSISTSIFNDFRSNLEIFGAVVTLLFAKSFQSRVSEQRLTTRIRWLLKGRSNFQLFPPLKLAFATGLLNPKTY